MTDTAAGSESIDKLAPQEESRVAAALELGAAQQAAEDAGGDPPLAADVASRENDAGTAGGETPPDGQSAAAVSGDAPPEGAIVESKPQPFDIDKTALIETPTQGLAVERGTDIPPAEAEPIKGMDAVDAPTGSAADEVITEDAEHPRDTIARMRAKLGAYGEECLKAVQPEIEYLISLCENP